MADNNDTEIKVCECGNTPRFYEERYYCKCGRTYDENQQILCTPTEEQIEAILKHSYSIERQKLSNEVYFVGTSKEHLCKLKNIPKSNPNEPKCPTCQSTDVQPISTFSRGASVLTFGLFSSKIGKTYECKNCKYKW